MKLNIGAGDCALPGYVNVDLAYFGNGGPCANEVLDGVDYDGAKLAESLSIYLPAYPLADQGLPAEYRTFEGRCDEIRASHILEHFPHAQVMDVLADWVRCLAPGGVLKIAVPDLPKVIAAYESGDPKALFYLMGGQIDERDFHKCAFDEETLRAAFETLGLVDVCFWNDGARDCSSLPISLNLQGRKPGGEPLAETGYTASHPISVPVEPEQEPQEVRVDLTGVLAVMTCPRVGFTDCAHAQYAAFGALGITLLKTGGVFWDQGISRVIEQAREAGARYVITIDYDSLFTSQDVVRLLWAMDSHPEIDALAALQMRRESDSPLFRTGPVTPDGGATEEVYLSHSALVESETLPVATAHLGLTVFRPEAFARLGRPWFLAVPDAEGGWGEGRMDSDIAFWHRWKAAGNSLHVALRVPIGHLEQVVTWPDAGMRRRMQGMSEWTASGKPEWAWS